MDFESALEYLEGFVSYEKLVEVEYGEETFDLRRVRNFLDVFGVDYSKIDFVHVAGSKGKGSVCTMMADYLWAKKEKAGLYTSPHILDIRERFQINGEKISQRLFALYVEDLKRFIEKKGDFELTYFELLTVLALKYFSEENVKYAIMETGLGGRLDATNVISPKVAVLTGVEMEHTDILGETLTEIINEKLGIMKEGTPLVVGPQSEEALEIIKTKLRGRRGVYFVETELENFDAKSRNGETALEALKLLAGNVDLRIFEEVVKNFKLVGRFDVREVDGKVVVFDMAHTPASMKVLAETLKNNFPGKDFLFLVSVLKGKKIEDIFKVLSQVTGKVVFTTLPCLERSIGRTEFEMIKLPFSGEISFKADCKKAFGELLEEIKKDQVLVVTGSHFLVGEILGTLKTV